MARKRYKSTGKGRDHSFVQFPHYMLGDDAFLRLSGAACKLLLYLASQYRGKNNGNLQATYKLAREAGWSSKANLARALAELEEAGFVERTRQGGRHKCSLFALTWFAVDDCDGRLDVPASPVASNAWRRNRIATPLAGQSAPSMGQSPQVTDSTAGECTTNGAITSKLLNSVPHMRGPS